MPREIVRKPWGFEYVFHKTTDVAVIHLRILAGDATSLHCHPTKKTAMLFLRGSGTVRFLNSQVHFSAPFHMILRPGLFHQIAATDGADLECLEIEAPPDPHDLVRLEDSYGREHEGYENSVYADDALSAATIRFHAEIDIDAKWVRACDDLPFFQGRFSSASELASRTEPDTSVLIFSGSLQSDTGQILLGPADIVSGTTVKRLASRFSNSTELNVFALSHRYGE